MGLITIFFTLLFIVVVVLVLKNNSKLIKKQEATSDVYRYSRKESVMTDAEKVFYKRLMAIVGGRYYIFPQIHLSALLLNQTRGRYWKAAFQRINRMSVDYVLCDKVTLKIVFAVELDDKTHNTMKRRARDTVVDNMLTSVDLPLVRLRNVAGLTDEQIASEFKTRDKNVAS